MFSYSAIENVVIILGCYIIAFFLEYLLRDSKHKYEWLITIASTILLIIIMYAYYRYK